MPSLPRDASMMLLTMSSKRLAQLCSIPIGFCRADGSSDPSNKELLKPMMPCKGDLSSWDTMAMMEAFRSSKSLSFVMSWPMQMLPVVRPVGARHGVAVSRSTAVRLCWASSRPTSNNSTGACGAAVIALLAASWCKARQE